MKPTARSVRLLGRESDGSWHELLRRVEAIIESPTFHPHLSSREWFKTKRRLMPWILLALPLLLTQLTMWGTYASYPPARRDRIPFNHTVIPRYQGVGALTMRELACPKARSGEL